MLIRLPKPPSVNHLYGTTTKGGFVHKYISNEGRQWFMDAGKILHDSSRRKAPIDYKITLNVHVTLARDQDVDNLGKCLFDLLQKCIFCMKNKCDHSFRLLKDDKLIYDFHIVKRVIPKAVEYVELEILPLQLDLENPCAIEQPTLSPEF